MSASCSCIVGSRHILAYLQMYNINFDTGRPKIEARNESIMVILDTIDIYSNGCEVYSERQVQDAIQQFTRRNKNIGSQWRM
jgi:hypothetical protein